jgi:hypothetical protein
MLWKEIGTLIWNKLLGQTTDKDRAKHLNKQSELLFRGVWDLYEEKKKLAENYLEQLRKIEELKKQHPENGKELQMWKDREYALMMELVRAKEEINFWRERAIFIEKENELLLIKEEMRNKKK